MPFQPLAFAARLLLALSLIPAAFAATPAPAVKAPQVDNPARVLFVGNSYFYYGDSLHNHVQRLVTAADPALEGKLSYKSATIGGAELAHHDIDYLTKPGRIGVKEPFQLVILQGGSGEPLSDVRRAKFRETAIEFDKVIKARGGKTALYMSQVYVKPHKEVKPDNLDKTASLYTSVGNEIGALVIPVGLAFEEAYKRRPGIQLHKDFDGSHPELIGTYLAACTVYASVYGKSPVGNKYDYYGKIDKEMAAFLQQVAADTVKKFYEK
ncbi:hypothetical protein DSM104443_02152 [Usitatibacter rugosus]|uniref:Lysophospholipase L1-like esterase n=1 Tax=Usitatibacter rugosus TaxID=2732067 RepID=A0A6M4GUS6_9PROT|nr:DUF4886 domain-containing protein [Usitatibacter rugosus]QJR11081.1 hypothetical protein DSM104443_02152 [Usitatibacter rugosus]